MCATGLVPTPDENSHSRSSATADDLEWGTLVKIFELNGGLPGPAQKLHICQKKADMGHGEMWATCPPQKTKTFPNYNFIKYI